MWNLATSFVMSLDLCWLTLEVLFGRTLRFLLDTLESLLHGDRVKTWDHLSLMIGARCYWRFTISQEMTSLKRKERKRLNCSCCRRLSVKSQTIWPQTLCFLRKLNGSSRFVKVQRQWHPQTKSSGGTCILNAQLTLNTLNTESTLNKQDVCYYDCLEPIRNACMENSNKVEGSGNCQCFLAYSLGTMVKR